MPSPCFRNLVPVLVIAMWVTGCGSGNRDGAGTNTVPNTLSFTNITEPAGLGEFVHQSGRKGDKWYPETMGGGAGFIDVDGDGWLDILLVEGGGWPDEEESVHSKQVNAVRLYRNAGDGTFEDYTVDAGLGQVQTYPFGVVVADYDNDGDDDFFLTTLYENLLFQNTDGRFKEVGGAAGITGRADWSTGSVFFDADRDGWLDLFVANYVDWTPGLNASCTNNGVDKSYCSGVAYDGIRNQFYKGNGNGTFVEASVASGFGQALGKTLAVSSLDFNADGWPDLALANDAEADFLYQNNGDGTFKEVGASTGMAFDENGVAMSGSGIDAGDVDNNGNLSVFVANSSDEMIGVYRYSSDSIFINRSVASQISQPSTMSFGFGLFLFDPNLDGYLDLFVANGHLDDLIDQKQDSLFYRQAPQLYINRRNGTFEEAVIEESDLLEKAIAGRGTAFGDIDRDGDQDVLIIENNGAAYLWRNDSRNGNALRVHLKGSESNAGGIGAEVLAYVAGEPQTRHVRTGGSYLSQSERTVTIGLGMHHSVDSVFISWPSGRRDSFVNVPAGQAIAVTEGESVYQTLYAF
ncbi:MAG: CRTAC1 family protein [Rhodothermales bacterium]